MFKKYVYFYFMKGEPEKIMKTVPAHIDYWKGCTLKNYLGGPFADRSGGLISFEAGSIEEAEETVAKDPFIEKDLLDGKWVKEWIAEK